MTQFEIKMANLFSCGLKRAVTNILRSIEKPVFNKHLKEKDIKQFSSYWVTMKFEEEPKIKGSPVRKLKFHQSFYDQLSKAHVNIYNKIAENYVSKKNTEIKTE